MTLHETTITENLYTFFNTASDNEKKEVFKLLYKEGSAISDEVFNDILLFNEQGDFPGKSRDEKGLPDLVFWGPKTLVFVEVKIDINTSTTNKQDGKDYDSYEIMLKNRKDLYSNRKFIYLVPKLYNLEINQPDIVKVVYWEDFIKDIHVQKINNPILNLIIDQLKLKEIYPDNMLLNKQEAVTFLSGTDELQKFYDIFEGNKRYKPIEIKTLGIDFHHYYKYKKDKKFGIGLYPYEADVAYGVSLYAEYSDDFMKKLNDYGLTKDKFKIDQEYVDNDWKYYIYFPLNYENDKDAILCRAEKIINWLNEDVSLSDFSQHCSLPFIDIAKVRSEEQMILKIKKLLEKYLKEKFGNSLVKVTYDIAWSCKYFGYRFNENHWLGLALFHSQKTRTWFLGYGDDKKWYSLTNKLECLKTDQCRYGKEKICDKGCYVDMDYAYEKLVLSFLFSATEQEQEEKFNAICDKLINEKK